MLMNVTAAHVMITARVKTHRDHLLAPAKLATDCL